MPTIKDFGSFKIYMYFEDHNPPHIHVSGPGYKAKMRISDRKLFAGNLPKTVQRKTKAYVESHMEELMALWHDYTI